jgi:hypothetical protein
MDINDLLLLFMLAIAIITIPIAWMGNRAEKALLARQAQDRQATAAWLNRLAEAGEHHIPLH